MKSLGAGGSVLIALAALYFLVPLAMTLGFSLWEGGPRYGFAAYDALARQPDLWTSLGLTVRLAAETVVLLLLLVVPSLIAVQLFAPRLRALFEIAAVAPFVVPAIALAAGLSSLYTGPAWLVGSADILVVPYTILALPFGYRAIDSGLRAMELRTLVEAGESLGIGWARLVLRVVLPNLLPAILGAALLTVAIVMGEFTFANVLLFKTFAVYIEDVGQTQASEAAALSMVSFCITWAAMLGILATGRRGAPMLGGAR